MRLLLVPIILLGVLVLVAPFAAGATLSRRHDVVVYAEHEALHTYVPPSMLGYVASESQVFFQDDPLTSHSLPQVLAHATIADDVLLDRVQRGAIPPDRIFPVDATWEPWGYELPQIESSSSSSYSLQLELEFTAS
jgi:hypothetical protein